MDNIALGLKDLPLNEVTIDSQFTTALGYADYIQKKFPEAKISVTGHSLGGSLALTVGAKRKLHTVAFNGPIPQKQLTAKERKYIVDNPTMFSNYLNVSDPIGNYNNSYGLAPLKGDFQHYYGKNSFVKMLEKQGTIGMVRYKCLKAP